MTARPDRGFYTYERWILAWGVLHLVALAARIYVWVFFGHLLPPAAHQPEAGALLAGGAAVFMGLPLLCRAWRDC